jgi:plasmid stabilization system protein ParE
VQARIQAIIDLLLRQPKAGQVTSNRRLRRMVASPYPYLIFYEVAEDEIVIHGLRHAALRPSE